VRPVKPEHEEYLAGSNAKDSESFARSHPEHGQCGIYLDRSADTRESGVFVFGAVQSMLGLRVLAARCNEICPRHGCHAAKAAHDHAYFVLVATAQTEDSTLAEVFERKHDRQVLGRSWHNRRTCRVRLGRLHSHGLFSIGFLEVLGHGTGGNLSIGLCFAR